mmetsp:Transcript_26557/g.41211  ORF Transcript_26557/g.41211 Transcript_26557/m.41211 type:complete len:316 (-) Transcript_26557:197-1144(-)
MAPQFFTISCTRAVMATPAILLFFATCVAQFISAVQGNNNVVNRNNNNGMIRGATHTVVVESSSLAASDENDNVAGGHKSHHKNHVPPDRKKSSHHDENHKNIDNSFDFYVFSMTFQPEFCSEKHEAPEGCHHPKQIWDRLTIHGLWPNNDDGTYPQNCSNEKFDLTSLQPIRDELEQQWPNIKALPNSASHGEFWEHEWSKHGTCTGLSQLEYFSKAVKMLMPTPSIVKDAETQHSVVKKDDLLAVYGGAQLAALVCKKNYLSEVRVCHQKETDGNVGKRMDCPQSILRESSCGSEIRIASFRMEEEEESATVE